MKQIINNGDTGLVARTIINENFSEVYQSLYDNTRVYVSGESVIIDNSGFKVYICNATTTAGESPITTASKWDIVGDGVGDMLLAGIQSVTGLKTYDKDKLAMKGTSTGINTISVANTGASDYSNEIPAKSGTFAMTSDITSLVFTVALAASALDADLTAATDQAIFAAPEDMTITQVFAKVGTAPVGSTIIVDVNVEGSSILSTEISIDASEKTSLTAATPPVISSASLTQGNEIRIDIDQIGASTAGKDLTVYILGTKA